MVESVGRGQAREDPKALQATTRQEGTRKQMRQQETLDKYGLWWNMAGHLEGRTGGHRSRPRPGRRAARHQALDIDADGSHSLQARKPQMLMRHRAEMQDKWTPYS